MIFLTFQTAEGLKLGVKTDAGVIDVAAASAMLNVTLPVTPREFYALGVDALETFATFAANARGAVPLLTESSLTLGPPVPEPGKILCVGLNYRKHAAESGLAAPPHPVLFSKFNNTIAATHETIPVSPELTQVDYEAELAVVIGRRVKNVSEATALDSVLGYCNANDISDRALQFASSQWLLGKTPDKFFPIGPYLVTADEAGHPQDMAIKGWLNGELRQDGHTADMIFTIAQIIAYASRYMTLYPGDIISTGTPEGVILGTADKIWMRPGDEYAVEIGRLGRLTNKLGPG